MKSPIAAAALLAAMFGFSTAVYGHSHKMKHGNHGAHTMGGVKVTSAWARATPGKAKNGAAYVTIANDGQHKDRLVAVKGSAAKKIEIHTHLMENGIMRMRRIEGVDVPAGGTVTFKPGGLHLMLMGLVEPLKKGGSLTLTLIFKKAGEVAATVRILSVGAMGAKGGHGHGGHSPHK